MRAVRRRSNAWAAAAARNSVTARASLETLTGERGHQDALGKLASDLSVALGGDVTPEMALDVVAQHLAAQSILEAVCRSEQVLGTLPVSYAIGRFLDALDAEPDDLIPLDERSEERRLAQPLVDLMEQPSEHSWMDTARAAYESFMAAVAPTEVKNLGIVYTPTEVADCMLRMVDVAARRHLGVGLSDAGVHVHDPFAGIGVFLSRLISGACDSDGRPLVRNDDVGRKFGIDGVPELHSNEIVPFSSAVATGMMCASAAERVILEDEWIPTVGVACGDAFLSHQSLMLPSGRGVAGSEEVRVVVSNPPWSAGKQRHSGQSRDHRPVHPEVAQRIRETYGQLHRSLTERQMGRSAGDLYVRALRWASDFVSTSASGAGIVAYIHPNAMLTASSLAGLRAGLRADFHHIYVINLRGRAAAEARKRHEEGARVFGQSSMTGVQITVLVRKPQDSGSSPARLYYAEAPDALNAESKMAWLRSVCEPQSRAFSDYGDGGEAPHIWLHPAEEDFGKMTAVLPTGQTGGSIIKQDTLGMATKMDAYVFSLSREALEAKVRFLLGAYEEARTRYHESGMAFDEAIRGPESSKIKWPAELQRVMRSGERIRFDEGRIITALHRPFVVKWLYCDERLIAEFGEAHKFRRDPHDAGESMLIPGPSDIKVFGVLATDLFADRNVLGYSHAIRVAPRYTADVAYG